MYIKELNSISKCFRTACISKIGVAKLLSALLHSRACYSHRQVSYTASWVVCLLVSSKHVTVIRRGHCRWRYIRSDLIWAVLMAAVRRSLQHWYYWTGQVRWLQIGYLYSSMYVGSSCHLTYGTYLVHFYRVNFLHCWLCWKPNVCKHITYNIDYFLIVSIDWRLSMPRIEIACKMICT